MHAAAAKTLARRARPQGWARQPWRLRYWLRASRLARLARACAWLPCLLGTVALLGWLLTKSLIFALLGVLSILLGTVLTPLGIALILLCCWRLTCRAGGNTLWRSFWWLLANWPLSSLYCWVVIEAV